jgi:diphosphomevalonate decarboxylase
MSDQKYKKEALHLNRKDISSVPKTVGWESPSNIALIKYWGKKENQVPISPSLSMTLSYANTRTEIHYRKAQKEAGEIAFQFNEQENPVFEKRIKRYINDIEKYFPFLKEMDLLIYSRNNFPHSAGLASSASALSSLALCTCSIEQELKNETKPDAEEFFEKASFMARLGSGSAARSIFGNFVEWGENTSGSALFAAPVKKQPHDDMAFLHDSILITSTETKKITSSKGHSLMNNHPYKDARVIQAENNFREIKKALTQGDFTSFAKIIENEALSLHALMLSSIPGYILLNDSAVKIIEKIRSFRERTGLSVAFTLDAGPNIHILYPLDNKEKIRDFINQELKKYCENEQVLHDFTGKGPERIDKSQNL